jgi:hypothetical protein
MNWLTRPAVFLLTLVIPASADEPDWERVNQHFFLRHDAAGKEYGRDSLDPLLWSGTKHLLVGESHTKALKLLDELRTLPSDPWPRALLQRDLWAVFDWTARNETTPERRLLQEKLARVLHRLRLSAADRAALPDNYAAAVKANSFPRLPAGILERESAWVVMGRSSSVAAPRHVDEFGARSVFVVLLRLTEGREAGVRFIKQLAAAPVDKPPPLPAGAEWALVRQLLVLGDDGKIHASPVTESIQIRRYPDATTNIQEVTEFVMSRARGGSLRQVTPDETSFTQFFSHGYDPLEWKESRPRQEVTLSTCRTCHGHFGTGMRSVLSYSRLFEGRYAEPPPVSDLSVGRVVVLTIDAKQRRYDWGLLEGLWRKP